MNNKQLTIKIINDELTISIGTNLVQHACVVGRSIGMEDIKITNENQFLESLVNQLNREEEDGSTLIHEMLDKAVSQMLEDGELGVDLIEEHY